MADVQVAKLRHVTVRNNYLAVLQFFAHHHTTEFIEIREFFLLTYFRVRNIINRLIIASELTHQGQYITM